MTCTAALALASLGILAASASADSLQTLNGAGYSGTLNFTLVGNATSATVFGTTTCDSSPITSSVSNPGSPGNPAAGSITAIDLKSSASQACSDNSALFDHINNTSQALPWGFNLGWVANDTGTNTNRNGVLELSGFAVAADTTFGTCVFRGDAGNTGGASNRVDGDFFNPDNTTSGNSELRLITEPLDSISPDPCPATATLTATYTLAGLGNAKLQIEQNAPAAPVCQNLNLSTGVGQPLPINLSCTSSGTHAYQAIPPAHGDITGFNSSTGAMTYTPDAGFTGDDSFTYRAVNAVGDGAFATVTIHVANPPANPPTTATTPSPTGQTVAAAKKCKKAKKGAAAAKKKCKKKK